MLPGWIHYTVAVRGGLARSGFGETGEALYLNSGFTYDSAEQAESSFKEETEHHLYSRFSNPTVAMFEDRLAAIEGAEACFATSSGMSAMFASVACLVKQGDHVVASASMFSSCYVVLNEILPSWGVTIELVEGTGWVNRRADEEIAKYHNRLEAASRAGKASAERRSNARSTTVQPNNKQETIIK